MHHAAFGLAFRKLSRVLFFVVCTPTVKLSHPYNTRANHKRRMENIEQENRELREEVATLKSGMAHLTSLMEALMAAQNQARTTPPVSTQAQTQDVSQPQVTVISEIISAPISVVPTTTIDARYQLPPGYPWGMPPNFTPAGFIPTTQNPLAVMTTAPPVMHTIPYADEQIYHGTAPSESVGIYDRMDDFQDQFETMQKEMKALRGKELFGENINDLCLVPNVQMPVKFKVPDFEKYKGDSCPRGHLVMYVRKMSNHTQDQRLLIHCFQDSLTGAALIFVRGSKEQCQSQKF